MHKDNAVDVKSGEIIHGIPATSGPGDTWTALKWTSWEQHLRLHKINLLEQHLRKLSWKEHSSIHQLWFLDISHWRYVDKAIIITPHANQIILLPNQHYQVTDLGQCLPCSGTIMSHQRRVQAPGLPQFPLGDGFRAQRTRKNTAQQSLSGHNCSALQVLIRCVLNVFMSQSGVRRRSSTDWRQEQQQERVSAERVTILVTPSVHLPHSLSHCSLFSLFE